MNLPLSAGDAAPISVAESAAQATGVAVHMDFARLGPRAWIAYGDLLAACRLPACCVLLLRLRLCCGCLRCTSAAQRVADLPGCATWSMIPSFSDCSLFLMLFVLMSFPPKLPTRKR